MLKDAIDLSRVKRALVIKLRHHGDVLLASPVFSVLKNHAPHIEIDALVYHDTRDMITLHPAVSEVFTIDRNWKKLGLLGQLRAEWGLLQALRARSYELVIVLNDHQRNGFLLRWIGAQWSVGPQSARRTGLYTRSLTHHFVLPAGTHRHMVEMQLDALRCVGLWPIQDERGLIVVASPDDKASAGRILLQAGLTQKSFILIHPGSRWFFKCWSVERMADLINDLTARGEQVVLTASPSSEEMEMVVQIESLLHRSIINLAGKFSLKEMAVVVAQARLMVGVDSLPMHLAAAAQTPVVALFGPTKEKVWGPWQSPHRLVMTDMSCRPCDRRGCGGSERSECIEQIPVGQVLLAIDELVKETA